MVLVGSSSSGNRSSGAQRGLNEYNPAIDSSKSLAERRTRRTIVKPKRYRDELPAALLPVTTRERQSYCTRSTIFGLSRRFTGELAPLHDPEEHVLLQHLYTAVTTPDNDAPASESASLYPYPNYSSFILGDWYWNGGIQKTQESFQMLIKIMSEQKFVLDDIRATNWKRVNETLETGHDKKWKDKTKNWSTACLTIPIPFHRLSNNPGVYEHTVATFHYRSLVTIIREKLENPVHHKHFHHEPYNLLWKSHSWKPGHQSVRIHGELYMSESFLNAHRELQESPREHGCELPRIIAALMFWSDATHLTSFGSAMLWPLYLFFGNDSKYRRSKPSNHLGEHVAFFEPVRHRLFI
jgi:hypothetical protein